MLGSLIHVYVFDCHLKTMVTGENLDAVTAVTDSSKMADVFVGDQTGGAKAQTSAQTLDISVRQGRVWVYRLQRMYLHISQHLINWLCPVSCLLYFHVLNSTSFLLGTTVLSFSIDVVLSLSTTISCGYIAYLWFVKYLLDGKYIRYFCSRVRSMLLSADRRGNYSEIARVTESYDVEKQNGCPSCWALKFQSDIVYLAGGI